jgi:hypothetical protein
MNAVTLLGNAKKCDANNLNAGLFKYLLFVAINAGTENIWSEADKNLKAWMRKQNQEGMFQSNQPLDRIKVLNHNVNFPWRTQKCKWQMHYKKLVEFHTTNCHCKVCWTCRLDN